MITGGSEAAVTKAGIGGFNAMHALSKRNDDPKTASRPFDKDRDGFVLGEGSGALIWNPTNMPLPVAQLFTLNLLEVGFQLMRII